MLESFPSTIATVAEKSLPRNQKMWWVRGIILDVQPVARPYAGGEKSPDLRDLLLKIGDVDNPEDGYDVRIEGIEHSIEPNDAVSLVGHEPSGAARVSYPRIFVNHNTAVLTRAYPPAARLPYGTIPLVEYKYWLAAKAPANSKMQKFWQAVLLCSLPYFVIGAWAGPLIAIGLFVVALIFLSPLIVSIGLLRLFMRWLIEQPRFSFEGRMQVPIFVKNVQDYLDFDYTDLTPLYEKLAGLVDAEVFENPAPELDFAPIRRGVHTVGLLTLPAEPAKRDAKANAKPGARPVAPV